MKLAASILILAVPSLALAGDPKAGAPATPPKDSKTQVPPAMPKPSAELAELAGNLAGTWKCTGKVSPDGTTMLDAKATMSTRIDIDKWWMQTNFTAVIGKDSYKFTGFTGFNSVEKKFYRYMFDNTGSSEWNSATGIDHGMADKWAMSWEGESRGNMAMGKTNVVKTRHTESFSKSEGLSMTGEVSMDGGKTWVKGYEAVCKK